jgi:hypothetical protein
MNRKHLIVMALIATVVVVILGFYYLTLPQPSTPTPEVPPRISSHTSYIDDTGSISSFIVIGEVLNGMQANVNVTVTASFYDAENNFIANASRGTDLEVLRPGQKSPFQILRSWGSSAKGPSRYELNLSYRKTNRAPPDMLEILSLTNHTDGNGYYIINGEVRNSRGVRALFGAVICTFYDSGGNVFWLSRTPVSNIDAGGKVSFELSSWPKKILPASYGLVAFVVRSEEVLISNYILLVVLIAIFLTVVVYMKRKGW